MLRTTADVEVREILERISEELREILDARILECPCGGPTCAKCRTRKAVAGVDKLARTLLGLAPAPPLKARNVMAAIGAAVHQLWLARMANGLKCAQHEGDPCRVCLASACLTGATTSVGRLQKLV
jgi:hypothetical protein